MTTPQLAQLHLVPAAAATLDARTALSRHFLLSSVAAVGTALSLWAGGALAQEAQDTQAQAQGTDQAQPTEPSGETPGATAQDQGQASGEQQAQDGASDALLATVGTKEIRSSDLMRAIGALPPPLNAQPPEILANIALEQLLLREAIVQEARVQGLAEDPEVQALVEGATQTAEEDALVQVWLQREISNRVTPEAVDQAYAGLQAVTEGEVPPLERIRPQIQQSLSQQTVQQIRASLLTGANITFYGPDGQPTDAQENAGGQTGGDGQAGTEGQSGDASGGQDQSQDDATGGEAAADGQSGTGEPSQGND